MLSHIGTRERGGREKGAETKAMLKGAKSCDPECCCWDGGILKSRRRPGQS